MYEIVPYDPALKAQIVQLWSEHLALNAAYFAWKYERNPYFQEPLVQVVLHAGRVVAMRGMFGTCWEAGSASETFRIPAADDLVIDPEHRARGLLPKLMRAAFDDLAARRYPCAFSLSPGAATLAGSLTTGWKVVGPMRPVQRITAARRVLRSLQVRLGGRWLLWRCADTLRRLEGSSRPFARLDREGRRARPTRPARISVATTPRVADMADLVRRLGHDGRLRHVRDEGYLAWRFQNPLHEYRFLFCDDVRLEGYLVLQTHRCRPGRRFNLVDWEGTSPARAELLRAALTWGRFPDIRAWTAALPGDAAASLLQHEFVQVPTGPGPLARHLPSILVGPVPGRLPGLEPMLGGLRLLDPASWDLRMIYSMAG